MLPLHLQWQQCQGVFCFSTIAVLSLGQGDLYLYSLSRFVIMGLSIYFGPSGNGGSNRLLILAGEGFLLPLVLFKTANATISFFENLVRCIFQKRQRCRCESAEKPRSANSKLIIRDICTLWDLCMCDNRVTESRRVVFVNSDIEVSSCKNNNGFDAADKCTVQSLICLLAPLLLG